MFAGVAILHLLLLPVAAALLLPLPTALLLTVATAPLSNPFHPLATAQQAMTSLLM